MEKYLTLINLGVDEKNVYFIETLDALKQCESSILNCELMGVDMENIIGDGNVSILQIATPEKQIYIIDVLKLKDENFFWNMICQLFKGNSLKIGQNIKGDVHNLQTINKNVKLSTENLIDLETLFKTKFPEEKKCSLAHIVEKILGKKLSKQERLGPWGKRPLRRYQMHYAALDSYLMLELYRLLN